MMSDPLQGKVAEYSSFITNTLQPKLQLAVNDREETEAEICEYAQLRNKLQMIETNNADGPINTLVDISHQTIYCNATISNPRTVYVHVGFGFHVEFTIQEAIAFIDKRITYLQNDVLKHRVEVAMGIAEDVEKALELLEEFKEADED
jgi:prefoldin subunit 5